MCGRLTEDLPSRVANKFQLIWQARTITADSICIGLEDAVAPAAKEEARMQV